MSLQINDVVQVRDMIVKVHKGIETILAVFDKYIELNDIIKQDAEETESLEKSDKLPAIKCRGCGKEFSPGRKNQVYCSQQCGYAHRLQSRLDKEKTERAEFSKKLPKGKCLNCSNEFDKNSGKRKFCSEKCKMQYHSRLHEAERKKNTPIFEYTCCICGKKFNSKKKNLKNGTCSSKCNNKHTSFVRYAERHPEVTLEQYLKMGDMRKKRKPVETRVCVYCGRDYVPTTEEQKYCSRICKDNAHAETKASTLKEHETSQPTIPKSQSEIVQGPTKDDPRTWEIRHCGVCDMTFEAAKGTNVRYCSRCLSHYGYNECVELEKEEKLKRDEEKHKTPFKVCSICGAYFTDTTPTRCQIFCERCRNKQINKGMKKK